jgi:hypothetical protein
MFLEIDNKSVKKQIIKGTLTAFLFLIPYQTEGQLT